MPVTSSFLLAFRILPGCLVLTTLVILPRLDTLFPPLTLPLDAAVCDLLELFEGVLPEVTTSYNVITVHRNVLGLPPEVLLLERAVGVVVDGKEHPLLFHILSDPLDEDLGKRSEQVKSTRENTSLHHASQLYQV